MTITEPECSGRAGGQYGVPYCRQNEGGCALHYPSEQQDKPCTRCNGAGVEWVAIESPALQTKIGRRIVATCPECNGEGKTT